ncbi:MAG: sugar phosphate isomerase/epimerase family protein, partial [Clostridia bacterium]
IGTCVSAHTLHTSALDLTRMGFECFAVNAHMHLDEASLPALAEDVRRLMDESGCTLSALGYYCNPLLHAAHAHTLHACIDAAAAMGVPIVSTFSGALTGQSVPESMPRFTAVFSELVRHAEDCGVRIALENCAMGGRWDHTTDNLAFNASAWDLLFDAVPSPALGLEWEATHQMVQLVEPLPNLRAYVQKVFHLHGKDATIRRDVLARMGINGPEPIVLSRFPGFGDTDWRKIFEILQANDYAGAVSIESYHDEIFQRECELTGQLHALQYLKWCRGGTFTPDHVFANA